MAALDETAKAPSRSGRHGGRSADLDVALVNVETGQPPQKRLSQRLPNQPSEGPTDVVSPNRSPDRGQTNVLYRISEHLHQSTREIA